MHCQWSCDADKSVLDGKMVIGWKSVSFIVKKSNKLPCKASSGFWVPLFGIGSVYLLGKDLPSRYPAGLVGLTRHAFRKERFALP